MTQLQIAQDRYASFVSGVPNGLICYVGSDPEQVEIGWVQQGLHQTLDVIVLSSWSCFV